MNCARGDLAEIINAQEHAAHLIGVRVVVTHLVKRPGDGVPCWLYDIFDGKRLCSRAGHPIGYLEDHNLRPIRGNELSGEDEMLSIARKNAYDCAITEQQERLTRLLEEVPKQ